MARSRPDAPARAFDKYSPCVAGGIRETNLANASRTICLDPCDFEHPPGLLRRRQGVRRMGRGARRVERAHRRGCGPTRVTSGSRRRPDDGQLRRSCRRVAPERLDLLGQHELARRRTARLQRRLPAVGHRNRRSGRVSRGHCTGRQDHDRRVRLARPGTLGCPELGASVCRLLPGFLACRSRRPWAIGTGCHWRTLVEGAVLALGSAALATEGHQFRPCRVESGGLDRSS